jgi:hypothetical protein
LGRVLDEPADEFSLAFGSSFRKNPGRTSPRRRFADPKPRSAETTTFYVLGSIKLDCRRLCEFLLESDFVNHLLDFKSVKLSRFARVKICDAKNVSPNKTASWSKRPELAVKPSPGASTALPREYETQKNRLTSARRLRW